MKNYVLLGALSIALASPASYAEELPKVLDVPIQAGMKVLRKFQAPGGLQGWVLTKGVQKIVVYTTPDGEHMLIGKLIDASDTNLTLQHVQKYILKRDEAVDTLPEN